VIDHAGAHGVCHLRERQGTDLACCLRRREATGSNLVEDVEQLLAIHGQCLPCSYFFFLVIRTVSIARSVAATISIDSGPIVIVSRTAGIRLSFSISSPAMVS
jgi:hypothetical protein